VALLEDTRGELAGGDGLTPEDVRIAIVGAGFSGLATAVRLKEQGIDDFVVLERAGDVGGTWEANTYPGCQCDIPSHVYSLSFAPNPDWSRTFSTQPEIWAYLRGVAQRHGVLSHTRLGTEVLEAAWDEDERRWRIETSTGALTAEVLVAAVGGLSEPRVPELPGLDTFEGTVFHSAQWNHDHQLDGERVAVVGTGASAIQFVPQIQPKVGKLHVFQRTPPWIMPNPDRPIRDGERRLYRRFPLAQRIVREATYRLYDAFVIAFMKPPLAALPERVAKRHLRSQVADPELRRKLTPSYRIGCKRILKSNTWFKALTAPNAEVVTAGIREVRPHSIVDADGVEREVDTIILGTGFHVTDPPIAKRVRGRDGRTMEETWATSGMEAYLGTHIAGFPNLFFLMGPNTGLGHNSVVVMSEAQIDYMLRALRAMDEQGVAALDIRPEVQRAYNAEIDRQLQGTVWNSGGCASWYMDVRTGRNATIWPGSTLRFRRRLRRFSLADYVVERRELPGREPAGAPAAA
jgi:cation diffusion facilitator CzcD-associated flavoprotein CzcO